MSLTGSDSSIRKSASPAAAQVSQVWLDGDVLACACPDCGAPMTIRLWLCLAECRMCGTQVELTEEQERAAQELLERREAGGPAPAKPPIAAPAKPPTWSQPVRPPPVAPKQTAPKRSPPPKAPAPQLVAVPVIEPPKSLIAAPPIAAPPLPLAIPVAEPDKTAVARRTLRPPLLDRDMLHALFSCLVSLLLHMSLIIVLGLWLIERPRAAPLVLRATFELQPAGPRGAETKVKIEQNKPTPPPPPPVAKPKVEPPKLRQPDPPKVKVTELAAEAIVQPTLPSPSFTADGRVTPGTMFAGRDPRVRNQVVKQEGGTDQTERAVAMGLKWLAKHQNADGSWSLDRFSEAGDCNGECRHEGISSDTAGTAMATLPFLGAGYTHQSGGYRDVVKRALDWLVADQNTDGSFKSIHGGTMYAHGQAAIALCEAYALTRDRALQRPAQRAIDYIVAAQSTDGGWRYQPQQRGDLSVTGWEVMALRSAQSAYLTVPPATLERVARFLDSVQTSTKQGTFGYQPKRHETPTMTAEGLLCRQYGGWKANNPALLYGADYLLDDHLPELNDVNMYYWYYATQVMHHIGGERWKRWNLRMRSVLVDLQDEDGHAAGSWEPGRGHDRTGGRLYMTALAVCTLEVYYRHLPLYRTTP